MLVLECGVCDCLGMLGNWIKRRVLDLLIIVNPMGFV